MKLMTFDAGNGTRVGLVNDDGIVDLTKHAGVTSLRGLIADGKVDAMAAHVGAAADHALDDVTFLPVIPDPAHIWCVGVNYMDHLQEAIDAGLPRSKSEYPMIFGRYADTMVGHKQNLMKSPLVHKLDYECELAVIIGKPGRHISKEDALSHVAGYSCFNEGSARDWQYHTAQVVPGKNFAKTGGFGPWMVTADEIPDPQVLDISTVLNGETMQSANTKDMIFDVVTCISYVSNMLELQPGDVIASGTPAGVGQSREPQVFMQPGDTCEIHIENVGVLVNPVAEG
ncbi:MAG: fumarylacetoacetate hydrolase family protein [Alphaproteobacteria bacterium]|jgi:2-keto-4-pentenoate hydratase/2-oxohepta-3-ene-1,7-dioic acid hydratase in catechol pathway|nr:fumarylacetoacetate hydrolase family protein [Alphaproteobacteria bacterium]